MFDNLPYLEDLWLDVQVYFACAILYIYIIRA